MTYTKQPKTNECIVCGDIEHFDGLTGYVFFADGHKELAAWCKTHCDEYMFAANPVFENELALALFKERHPIKYNKDVKGKTIVFSRFASKHVVQFQSQENQKEKQSPEMTQPRETSKAVQSMNSESNSINSAYGADGLLDNSVSPRKEKCQVGGVPQNVATCKELKENATP